MRGKVPAVALLFLCIVQFSSPAWPQTTTFIGCLDCVERTYLTFPRDSCSQVGHEEEGWTSCTEETWGLYRFCSLGGSACFNVDAGGGGGSGSGGGGGSSCVIGPSASCPAECFSCERDPYRV
jgi:hypothetical protein